MQRMEKKQPKRISNELHDFHPRLHLSCLNEDKPGLYQNLWDLPVPYLQGPCTLLHIVSVPDVSLFPACNMLIDKTIEIELELQNFSKFFPFSSAFLKSKTKCVIEIKQLYKSLCILLKKRQHSCILMTIGNINHKQRCIPQRDKFSRRLKMESKLQLLLLNEGKLVFPLYYFISM